MAFDFPASPSVGQEYVSGGVSYTWNGYAWMQSAQPPANSDAPADSKTYGRRNNAWINLATTELETGRAKAYAKINQTGVQAIIGSFNISSVTDPGVGQSQCNLTALMQSVNVAMGTSSGAHNTLANIDRSGALYSTASILYLVNLTSTATLTDVSALVGVGHGVLA